uniref:Transmembrane protein n=1 Tax=Amphimedon queenslandica TaxID=400682 RepID=A0A1X7UC43_AMPQE
MDNRVSVEVQKMFTTLSSRMHPEAWKRSVVVLTFANFFVQLQNVPPSTQEEEEKEMREEIKTFEDLISKAVSNKEVFSGVPFCIAGKANKNLRKLPTTNDWLLDLWKICLRHCSDEARSFFTSYTTIAIIAGLVLVGTLVFVGGYFIAPAAVPAVAAAASVATIGSTALGASLQAKIGIGLVGSTLAVGTAIILSFMQEKETKEKKKDD